MASTTNSRVRAAPVHNSQRGKPRVASNRATPRRCPGLAAACGARRPQGLELGLSLDQRAGDRHEDLDPMSSVPHPRVDPGVDQVDEKADDHHGEGENRDYALDGDVVAVLQVVDQLVADPRPVEGLLGEHRPREQERGLEPGDGDDGDQGVLEGVVDHHVTLAQAPARAASM